MVTFLLVTTAVVAGAAANISLLFVVADHPAVTTSNSAVGTEIGAFA